MDFTVGIGAFRVWEELNIDPYSPLKPTKVGFIFIGPNFVSQAIRSHSCQSRNTSCRQSLRLGLKARFKKLCPEPRLLNLGLRYRDQCFIIIYVNLQINLFFINYIVKSVSRGKLTVNQKSCSFAFNQWENGEMAGIQNQGIKNSKFKSLGF